MNKMKHCAKWVIPAIVAAFFAAPVSAATMTCTGGNMSIAASWGGALPAAGDNLRIDGVCTVDNAFSNFAYGSLTVGRNANGTLQWPAGGTATLNVTTVSTNTGHTGTIDMTGGGTLQIRSSWTTTRQTFIPGAGTVNWNVISNVSLPSTITTYNNLTIVSGNRTTSLGVNTTVNGNLLISTGTLSAGTRALNIMGDFINNSAFTPGTGTVTFNGAGAQALGGTATTTFNNLTISKATGDVTITSASVAFSPTVNGVLTLTNGHVITSVGINDLGLGTAGTVSGGSAASYVVGAVQKTYNVLSAATLTFPVGDGTNYTPVTIQDTAGFAAGSLTISTTGGGDHPSIGSSGIDPTKSVNRYWTLTAAGLTGTYNATFNYISGSPVDLDSGVTPANFIVEQWDGTNWFPTTNGTCTSTQCQITGETGFGDFAIGEPVAGFNGNPGVFNTFETTTSNTQILGRIFTKLVGTSFPVSIVAVSNNARNTLPLAVSLTVDVIDASPTGGAFDAPSNCYSNWTTVIQTQTVVLPVWTSGRINVTINAPTKAVSNARIRVTQGASKGCSTDNFAIRPASFTSVVSGAPTNMNNATTSGPPSAIAGSGTFTLIAATGVAGYTGTPKIDNTAVEAHAGAKQNGAVSGTFPAAATATGTSTGTSAFTYSEVGNFRFLGYAASAGSTTARGVYDDTFTSVDSPADCTADFSNVLTGGQYGCKFGIIANSSYFGRFYPKDFLLTIGTLTNRQAASCAPVSNFTYAGEQFGVTFTLTARNGAATPVTTKNYDPTAGFASLNANTIANLGFGAVDLADAIPPLTATALTTSLTLGSSSGTWASGSVPVAAYLMLTRAAAPNGPFESFNLGIAPVDADGVKLNNYDLDTNVPADGINDHGLVGTSKIRFGRLKLANAYGSELIKLPVSIQTQYWNGSGFVTNAADNCTTLAASNIKLTTPPAGVSATTGGAFSSGVGSLTLSKPTTPANVAVDLCVDLGADPVGGVVCSATSANLPYLQSLWSPGTSYNNDPAARATFGVYKGANEFIYFREAY